MGAVFGTAITGGGALSCPGSEDGVSRSESEKHLCVMVRADQDLHEAEKKVLRG